MPEPEIAVAVASHRRPMRLRWLLHALAEQTLDRPRFEVVVAHDGCDEETGRLLASHALARAGTLRQIRLKPGDSSIARLRNAAWQGSVAPLVAFTDDDCRPAPEWLERALVAANPRAIVQGTTRPEPDELHGNGRAPWRRSQHIDPPVPWAQGCNIVYPRELLERVGGFLEIPPIRVGEDTDLAERAQAEGARLVGEPKAITYHAIEDVSLPARLRSLWRWSDLPLLVVRHPRLRRQLTLGLFWRPAHARLVIALGGMALARGLPPAALLVLPWAHERLPSYGPGWRGRGRAVAELPGRAAIDAVEIAALAIGSVRHRQLVL